jgi:CHAT domain-containing protein
MGDSLGAIASYTDAVDIARAISERQVEVDGLNGLGQALLSNGDVQPAIATYDDALRLAREGRLPAAEGLALRNLMIAWRIAGRPQLGAFFGKQAVNLFQNVRANILQLEPQTQKAYLQSKEETYRELADLLVSEGRLPEAQQVLDFLKEQEFRDYVRRGGEAAPQVAMTPDEAAWQERYRQIQDRIAGLGRERSELVARRMRSAEENAQLARLDADLGIAARAFQAFLDSLAADFGTRPETNERVFQLREAQGLMADLRELGPGTVALYTIVGELRYRVILITPDVQKAAEFRIDATDLAHKVLAFREALQDPYSDPKPLAQELYTVLVGPIAKDLEQAGARTLMWALDGVLRYLPFSALHDGRSYLVERYRTVVLTPASKSRLKDRSEAWTGGLGVGVSKAVPGFTPLPAVADELRGIINDDRAENSSGILHGHVLLDEAFTEPALKAELLRRPRVVHIASHFQFRPGDEADSFLLLGDGHRLSVADLKNDWNLFDGVDLLTLSACNTASGGLGATGKEVESFGVLAQRQGAKAVIATLWQVADLSTRLLMEQFYRVRTADGAISKAEALRRAQLTLLDGEHLSPHDGLSRGVVRRRLGTPAPSGPTKTNPYSHPYYWAPFLLIGNWR